MGLFRKKTLNDLIPIHSDNIGNKDWVILLEAGTIVGSSPQRICVVRCMQEKNILEKSDMLRRTQHFMVHFMVIEGYNPRIHAVYLCPQLFRYDSDKLVSLQGEEIAELIALKSTRPYSASAKEFLGTPNKTSQPITSHPRRMGAVISTANDLLWDQARHSLSPEK